MSLLLRSACLLVVGCGMVGLESAHAQPAQQVEADVEVEADTEAQHFVTGGGEREMTVTTPWARRAVRWKLTAKAGGISSGQANTGQDRRLSLRAALPNVRAPAKLALELRLAQEAPDAPARHAIAVWALPADPFADVRRTLDGLTVHARLSEVLDRVVEAHEVSVTDADDAPEPTAEASAVLLLDTAEFEDAEALRDALKPWPAQTAVIVMDRAEQEAAEAVLESFGLVREPAPPEALTPHTQEKSVLWQGLQPDWFGGTPRYRLQMPRGFVRLRLHRGGFDDEGRAYPLALSGEDVAGRHVLIWTFAEPIAADDPRWALVLRNSLLWASKAGAPERRRDDGGY